LTGLLSHPFETGCFLERKTTTTTTTTTATATKKEKKLQKMVL